MEYYIRKPENSFNFSPLRCTPMYSTYTFTILSLNNDLPIAICFHNKIKLYTNEKRWCVIVLSYMYIL